MGQEEGVEDSICNTTIEEEDAALVHRVDNGREDDNALVPSTTGGVLPESRPAQQGEGRCVVEASTRERERGGA